MKKRAPRFKRMPKAVGGLRIQERDIEIIRLVYEYRFLDSEQIHALVGGSRQVILRRLKKLYHHGYLDRPISQITFSNPFFGPQKMVYALGDKGADLLAEVYGIDRGGIIWSEKNREVRERYIQHTLMISNFRACLSLALRDLPDVRLLFWVRENPQELKDYVSFTDESGRHRRLPIVPDGFFGIEDPQGRMFFFLEADRSTMTNARFLRKLRAYWLWWKQGGHRRRFGIESFRVLTITRTERRKENLRRVAKKADDRQIGSLMFWFTSEERYDIRDPRTILGEIWQTPRDERWHSLLE